MTLSKTAIAVTVPSYGPAIVTLFGADFPVLSLALSVAGVVLSRIIAPPSARHLTRRQEWALTALLIIVNITIVMGGFGGDPLGPGMAAAWGIGLGYSGLLVVEFFGKRIMHMLKALAGQSDQK